MVMRTRINVMSYYITCLVDFLGVLHAPAIFLSPVIAVVI